MNKPVRDEVIELVKKIKEEIISKNIDVYLLCEKIYMPVDSFVKIINNPQDNASLYLEILEVIEEM